MSEKFQKAIKRIDHENSKDPRQELHNKTEHPKELLYSLRMTDKLLEYCPNASDELQIAARAQHINRWKIQRNAYSIDRSGYLKWREDLKKMHASVTSNILQEIGYEANFIRRVAFLINKKLIKKDDESQILEDVVCLVFFEYYFETFSMKHNDEKLHHIIKKTWKKMSNKAQKTALKLQYSTKSFMLIKQAIS